jgi:hypothetical protein
MTNIESHIIGWPTLENEELLAYYNDIKNNKVVTFIAFKRWYLIVKKI